MSDYRAEYCAQAQRNIDRSHYRTAAMACGFSFSQVRHHLDHYFTDEALCIAIDLRCVCGKRETALWIGSVIPSIEAAKEFKLDFVEWMYREGSFSEEHLLKDGYSPEFAARTAHTFEVVLRALLELRVSSSRPALYDVMVQS